MDGGRQPKGADSTAATQVRASWAKTLVASAKRARATQPEILAAIDGEVRRRVRGAAKLGWIDAGDMTAIARSIHDAVGPARARSFWRGCMTMAIDTPLLSPLKAGAFSLFGRDPYKILRMTPRVWDLLIRGGGSLECSRLGDAGARFDMADLALEFRQHPVFLDMVAGAAETMIDQCDREGTASVLHADPDTGRATIDILW